MEKIRVLVTGAGSGVGQGIIKSLKSSSLSTEIHGADISPANAGLYVTDKRWIIPKVENPGALDEIIALTNEQALQVLLVGSEFDLSFFSDNKKTIEKETGALVLVSPPETVAVSEDKYKTAMHLKQHGLPYAQAFIPESLEDAREIGNTLGHPFVLKTRKGTSNRHVHIIESDRNLADIYHTVPDPMCQELIARPSASLRCEYTCSIFKCANGNLFGPFTARRTLKSGNSWLVEVKSVPGLSSLLQEIGRSLEVEGSLNVQLMIGDDGPVPFEFNARFSGTTAVRAHFGFNEPEMALRSYFLKQELAPPAIRGGMAFRYLEEVFLDGIDEENLDTFLGTGIVNRWF